MFGWKLSRFRNSIKRDRNQRNSVIVKLGREIRRSDLFDIAWYLRTNPDVRNAGLDPVEHYLRYGAREGRDPSPSFNTREYIARNPNIERKGLNPLIHYLRSYDLDEARSSEAKLPLAYRDQILTRFVRNEALPVFLNPSSKSRINLILDSLDSNSLYGGVGTAIVFAALLSNRTGRALRVVTRDTPPAAANFQKLLSFQGIDCAAEVEFCHSNPRSDSQMLDITLSDTFITTSWWTTSCVSKAVSARNIVYILQEDERIFYPNGDDRLRCSETLASSEIRFVVNTKLLFDHLVGDGFRNIAERGIWFEPSFSPIHYCWDESGDRSKLNFLFYARPENPRNLYYRGLEVIAAAIEMGLFDADQWSFHFAGKDLAPISLPRSIQPILHQNLAWLDYAKLVRSTDLGLCLIHSPHPSYPPLDLAASGAVVLSTSYGRKESLDQYSRNIMLCSDTTVSGLMIGLQGAITRARDFPTRRSSYETNCLLRDWSISFKLVLESLQGAVA